VSDSTITFLVLAVTVAVFAWDRLAPSASSRSASPVTLGNGRADDRPGARRFGDPTVIFIASLFVVSEALDSTGVTAWAGQQLIAGAGRVSATPDRADDAHGRGADGADQRQRLRSPRSCPVMAVTARATADVARRSSSCRSRSARMRDRSSR
jgi:hypothetical protein